MEFKLQVGRRLLVRKPAPDDPIELRGRVRTVGTGAIKASSGEFSRAAHSRVKAELEREVG